MTKFSEYIKNDISDNIQNSFSRSEDINDLIDKYSTYSYEELMNEFLKESDRKKKIGELSDSQLDTIKSTLKPYLSEEKQNKLDDLFNVVKKWWTK